jgi:hypothetical protein
VINLWSLSTYLGGIMKKVLVLLLMASATQGLISQEQPSPYKYLKQLPDNSRIKRMCYPVVESRWFWTSKNECDALEKLFEMNTVVDTDGLLNRFSNEELRGWISEESWPKKRANMIHDAKKTMRYKSFGILRKLPAMQEIDRANEAATMADLAGKVCEESFDQFEKEVLARATK